MRILGEQLQKGTLSVTAAIASLIIHPFIHLFIHPIVHPFISMHPKNMYCTQKGDLPKIAFFVLSSPFDRAVSEELLELALRVFGEI